jgi:hypothetical protein
MIGSDRDQGPHLLWLPGSGDAPAEVYTPMVTK